MISTGQIHHRQPLIILGAFLAGVITAIAILGTDINFENTYKRLVVITSGQEGALSAEEYVISPSSLEQDSPGKAGAGSKIVKLHHEEDLFYHYHSSFLSWLFAMCSLVGISWALFLPVWYSVQTILTTYNFGARYKGKRGSIINYRYRVLIECILIALLILIVAVLLSGGGWLKWVACNPYFFNFFKTMLHFEILLHNPEQVSFTLILLANITAVFAVAGIYLINRAVTFIEEEYPYYDDLLERFAELSRTLDFFLVVLALIVSGGVITSALNREMIIEALPDIGPLMAPIEFVYLYSLGFTIFLALIYIPVYYQLRRKGQQILKETRDVKKGLSGPKGEAGGGALPAEDILLLKHSTATNVKLGLAILGPVISSLAGNLGVL